MVRDGYRLTVDDRHLLELSREGAVVTTINGWSTGSENYRIDMAAPDPVVTFLDPTTGEALVDFTVAELAELERAASPSTRAPEMTLSIYFSGNADAWHGGEVATVNANGGALTAVHIGQGRLLAVLLRSPEGGFGRSFADLRYELLVAPIPGQ